MPQAGLPRELRLRDLVFIDICAIASFRWLAPAAHAGSGSLILWVFAAVFFFVPSAVVVGRLAARFPEEGGMYVWTKHAFGDRHAFLCAWFYFLSNILFLPSLALSGVSMAAWVVGDAGSRLADNRAFALPLTLALLWTMFAANFFGLKIAKWISVFGGLSIFVVALTLGLFAIAKAARSGSATEFHLLPEFRLGTLNFWSQIAFAFLGLELAPVMGGEMRDPRRDLSRAAVISGGVCVLFYIGGTASILVLLRPEDISPLTGLTQAVAVAARAFGAPAVSAALAMFIGLGIAGQLDTWIAGNTRLPYAIGLDHYLPEAFERLHPRWKTPYVSLRIQVIACTVFLLMSQWGESVRAAYQIMVDMTVVVTFIPFLYIFGAGFRFGNRLAATSGLAVTLMAIVFASIPPAEIASPALFEVRVVGGGVLLALAGLAVFNRCQPRLQPQCRM